MFGQQPPEASQAITTGDIRPGDPTVVVTNTSNDLLCANTYVFDTYKHFVACCATLIAPDQFYTASVRRQLNLGESAGGVPVFLIIKLVASQPIQGAYCNASSPSPDRLVPGLRASYARTQYSTESFENSALSTTDLRDLTDSCTNTQVNYRGSGICATYTQTQSAVDPFQLPHWLAFFL